MDSTLDEIVKIRLELPTKEEEKLSDLVNVVLKQEKKPHLSLVSHRI